MASQPLPPLPLDYVYVLGTIWAVIGIMLFARGR